MAAGQTHASDRREISQPSPALAARAWTCAPPPTGCAKPCSMCWRAGNPAAFEGKVWLDLCAGTGAVGIEALSRGAAKVYFVESSSSGCQPDPAQSCTRWAVETGFEILKRGRHPRPAQAGGQETSRPTSSFSILPTAWRKSTSRSLTCSRNPLCFRPDASSRRRA